MWEFLFPEISRTCLVQTQKLFDFALFPPLRHFNVRSLSSQGTRYVIMGQIYHRRRHLPSELLNLLGGKLKPGDGILRSNSYVKRYNKRRHQKALEATRSRCRWTRDKTIAPRCRGRDTAADVNWSHVDRRHVAKASTEFHMDCSDASKRLDHLLFTDLWKSTVAGLWSFFFLSFFLQKTQAATIKWVLWCFFHEANVILSTYKLFIHSWLVHEILALIRHCM